MLILPLKFIREEDKKTVGLNLFNLARLSHFGLPVIDSVVVIPPIELFVKVISKYKRHNINLKDHLNNIKNDILKLPVPESLNSFELINFIGKNNTLKVNISKLWENLLSKWAFELNSRIERGEKSLLEFTPQLVVFSANFNSYGRAFFDEDKDHCVIKTDKGKVDFKVSEQLENLVILGNKKLLLPQVYYWAYGDEGLKILKVTPFTQSISEKTDEKIEKFIPAQKEEIAQRTKTATKIFLDYSGEVLTSLNSDGIILRLKDLNIDSAEKLLSKITAFGNLNKVIFYPEFEPAIEKNLEFAKNYLFFRNKRRIDAQIVLPQTNSIDEFLKLKREFASLGIYSKGSLKIWKQFNTVADFLNIDEYLNAGFDGAIVNLDKIAEIVCGVRGEKILSEPKIDWLNALEKFFKELGFNKLIKNHKQVLITGKLARSEELLHYFIKSGIFGIALEASLINTFSGHINFIEKQTIKNLVRGEIKH